MDQIKNILPITEYKHSSDNRPYVEKLAEWRNAEKGDLNERDGVDCDICKNKGIIYTAEPPNPVLMQKHCGCMAKRKSITFANKSGLGELLKHKVSTFLPIDEWQKKIKHLAIEYVQNKSADWFCLLGQSGAGKTHLCSAISKTFIDRGIETKYVVWNTFIRDVKSNMLEDKTMMRKYQIVPVLYIDDLLKGRYTDTDITLLFDLVNYRYNNNLTTIITTELSFAKLMEIDSAVAGRIKEKSKKFLIEIEKDDSKNFRLR